MPAPADSGPDERATGRDAPVGGRIGRLLVIIGGIAAAGAVALGTGAVTLQGAQDSAQSAQSSADASPAARRMAADQQWASATCTNILEWKAELQRDATSIDLSFGPLARVQDAISATTRMSSEAHALGLPPSGQAGRTRAEIDRLRSEIDSRVRTIEGAAGSVASGNLAAVGSLLVDLESSTTVGPQIVGQLRRVVSVDLGLSLVETSACRRLVGIPI
jgi:hypothetical protein